MVVVLAGVSGGCDGRRVSAGRRVRIRVLVGSVAFLLLADANKAEQTEQRQEEDADAEQGSAGGQRPLRRCSVERERNGAVRVDGDEGEATRLCQILNGREVVVVIELFEFAVQVRQVSGVRQRGRGLRRQRRHADQQEPQAQARVDNLHHLFFQNIKTWNHFSISSDPNMRIFR